MQTSQLNCPHCGSTLNFGVEITPGSAVDCLICMRSFVTHSAYIPAPEARPAPTGTVAGKNNPTPQATTATVATAKYAPKSAPLAQAGTKDTPARPARGADPGSQWAALAVAAGLFMLVSGGIGVAVWKFAGGSTIEPPKHPDPLAYVSTKTTTPNPNPPGNGNKKFVDSNPVEPKDPPPDKKIGITKDDDDDRKLHELKKKGLERKIPVKSVGSDAPIAPITAIDVPNKLPSEFENQIDAARAKGIAFLRKQHQANGTWVGDLSIGRVSLACLALLECKVPATDSVIQNSARFVRNNLAENNEIYDMSVAVLFLDRLGDPRDRLLIQGLALRIMAGQLDGGAWAYKGRQLDPQEMYQLLKFLQSHRANPKFTNPNAPYPLPLNNPYRQFSDLVFTGIRNPKSELNTVPIRPESLKQILQDLPIVQNQGAKKGQFKSKFGEGDLSNTQFALLALWAARRHDVSADHVILATQHRLSHSQNPDGGWTYSIGASYGTMTCVGLLGQAMGHAVSPESKPALADPTIKAGLKALAVSIGEPSPKDAKSIPPIANLYLLWSIERIALLYDLKTIEGKDWNGWGAEVLVKNQQPDGSWIDPGYYHGATPVISTCFALLFLSRSNLVQDLTETLQLQKAVRD